MRLFSRIVFICNICFILAVILRFVEMSMRAKGNFNGAIKFQPLESTLVILGYGAVFLNFFFILMLIFRLINKKPTFPRWLVFFNVMMFPLQLYYFFYSNF